VGSGADPKGRPCDGGGAGGEDEAPLCFESVSFSPSTRPLASDASR